MAIMWHYILCPPHTIRAGTKFESHVHASDKQRAGIPQDSSERLWIEGLFVLLHRASSALPAG